MEINRFAGIIASKTGISVDKIKPQIKSEDSYPVGDIFEKNIGSVMDKFCGIVKSLDAEAEKKPVDMDQFAMTWLRKMGEGLTADEYDASSELYNALKSNHGESIDDNHVLPTSVKDMGDGVFEIDFSRNLLQQGNFADNLVNDVVEEHPDHVLFLDTTPGEKGLRSFYTAV